MNQGPRSTAGFTLAETILAVGISMTVILLLVGLIPPGLDQMRQAATTTAEARIVQAIAADYQMRPWSLILTQHQAQTGVTFHFDGQGARVAETDPAGYFTARATVENASSLPGTSEPLEGLRRIRVLITDQVDPNAGLADPQGHREYCVVVAQTDKPE